MSGIDRKKWKNWLLPLRRQVVRAVPKWLPWTFFGVILILAYFGIADIHALAAKSSTDATLTAAELKDRIDELKWTLGLILVTAGLFTLAQGIATGFSAQSFTKQAEDDLAHIEKIEKDIRSQYPVFSMIEKLRVSAFSNLTKILTANSPVQNPDEGFNWRRRFYEKVPLIQRQELLSVEQFNPYEIAGQNDPDEVYASNLRRLALFYWSKFIYERDRGFGNFGDLECAEYLIELAGRRIGRTFYLYNDLGNIRLLVLSARMDSLQQATANEAPVEAFKTLDLAIDAFQHSIEINPDQIRAYFNLAVIEKDHHHQAAEAIKWLERGLKHTKWEHEVVPEFTCAALFNLGCYYGYLANTEKQPEIVQQCLEALKKAAEIGTMDPNDVQRELLPDISMTEPRVMLQPKHTLKPLPKPGDLLYLLQFGDNTTKQTIAELLPRLSANFRRE
jgi:tetratricopeptide (TPR) repeat protein